MSTVKVWSGGSWLLVNANYGRSNRLYVWDATASAWRRVNMSCQLRVRSGSSWVVPNRPLIAFGVPLYPDGDLDRSFYSLVRSDGAGFHFVYSTDGNADPSLYYNKYEYNGWTLNPSRRVVHYNPQTTTLAAGTLLMSSSAMFYNETDVEGETGYYKNALYFVNQPNPSLYWPLYGQEAYGGTLTVREEVSNPGWGLVYATFSNDLVNWTVPCQVFTVVGGVDRVLYAEQVSAIYRGGTLYLIVVEGKFDPYFSLQNTVTYARLLYLNPTTHALRATEWIDSSTYFDKTGITGFNPGLTIKDPSTGNTYTTMDHPICFNAFCTLDEDNHYLYMTRAYAYPYHFLPTNILYGVIPVFYENGQCVKDPAGGGAILRGLPTLPNRVQLYRKYLGSPTNGNRLYDSTYPWELLGDWGWSHGYRAYYLSGGQWVCGYVPLQSGQSSIDMDANTMTCMGDEFGFKHPVWLAVVGGDTNAGRTVTGLKAQSRDYHSYMLSLS